MVVHIAAIGTETGHVTEWLRNGSVEKIYLLHSKKTAEVDFPKKARELEKKIKEQYPDCIIYKRVIENAFNLDDTQDAISEIIYYERKKNEVENHEFKINVTGGTAVQAAAAVLSAFKHGTKAYYILNRRKNKNLNSYVEELPIPSIGIAKMNKTQQQALQFIAHGRFLRIEQEKRIDNVTKKLKKFTNYMDDDKITGKLTNQQLLKIMQLDEPTSYKGGRIIKKGTTKIHAVVQKLKSKGYIIIHKEIPALEKIPLRKLTKDETSGGRYDTKKITVSQVMYEITPAGRRQAKDTMMSKE